MVLTERFQEPLGAITEESLANEGFGSLAEFRRYWCDREKRRFTPTRMVVAYRVRPWIDGVDERRFADQLLERLYGPHLP